MFAHPDKEALKKCLFEEKCCWYCGCEYFLEGPSGGMSQNMICSSCWAKYNISPFSVDVVGFPSKAPGCLIVGRQEREETVLGRLKEVVKLAGLVL